MKATVGLGVAGLVATAACGAGARDSMPVERTDSAGIEIVRSPGGDAPLDRIFEVSFSLGGQDSGPASFYRLIPQGIAVDAAGDLAILDVSASRVVVFDSTGRFVRSMGSEGGGPGEFRAPGTVAMLADGTVAVHDFAKIGLEWFDPMGRSKGFQPLGVPFRGGRIVLSDSGGYVPTRTPDRDAGVASYRLLWLGGADTVPLAEQTRALGRSAFYESCAVSITLEPLFTPWLRWNALDDRAVVANGDDYLIDVYRGAQRVRSLRRDISARDVTEAMARAELGDGEEWSIGGVPCTIRADELLEKRGYASRLAAVEDITLTPRGEIWVRRASVGEEPVHIDVFGDDGAYRGTLPETAPWPAAFLPDGRLVAIVQDDRDIDRVVVYAVRDGPGASRGAGH